MVCLFWANCYTNLHLLCILLALLKFLEGFCKQDHHTTYNE